MKRIHLLLVGGLFLAIAAVGYSDSHVIKKDTIQAYDHSIVLASYQQTAFVAVLPSEVIIDAPDLGSPASNYIMVSEKLADVLKMCIRPPPEKVQKSEYNFEIRA